MNLPKTFKLLTLATAFVFTSNAFAADSININQNDVAMHGYDPIGYFTQNKPVKGRSQYSAVYNDAIYHFSSAKNRDKFNQNPEKYAPQFGGFCAMGVVLNKKLDVDPNAWYIEDDKLYLNLNADVQKKWLTDVEGHIDEAEQTWFGIQETSVAELNDD